MPLLYSLSAVLIRPGLGTSTGAIACEARTIIALNIEISCCTSSKPNFSRASFAFY